MNELIRFAFGRTLLLRLVGASLPLVTASTVGYFNFDGSLSKHSLSSRSFIL